MHHTAHFLHGILPKALDDTEMEEQPLPFHPPNERVIVPQAMVLYAHLGEAAKPEG